MCSSMPQLIKTYKTILYGQEVEVNVYAPGKSRRVSEDIDADEVITEITEDSADPTGKDLTELLEQIETFLEDREDAAWDNERE